MITAIACVSKNFGIGYKGELLFHIPEDMKFFRGTTKGHIIVMGRKTLDSFPEGKPLPNRRNIVLTRDKNFSREGVGVCHNAEEVLTLIGKEDTFIAGGGEVYREMLPYCDFALVTKVDAEREADAFFPDIDSMEEWELAETSPEYDFEGLKYRFCTYFTYRKQR